jgi:hypothetical protein
MGICGVFNFNNKQKCFKNKNEREKCVLALIFCIAAAAA